jgi:hypothetical protein
MSETFSLVCRETKQMIWVGQGARAMTNFYSGQPEVMRRLGRFLEATRGKELVLLCNDTEGAELIDYEEFEDPEP